MMLEVFTNLNDYMIPASRQRPICVKALQVLKYPGSAKVLVSDF